LLAVFTQTIPFPPPGAAVFSASSPLGAEPLAAEGFTMVELFCAGAGAGIGAVAWAAGFAAIGADAGLEAIGVAAGAGAGAALFGAAAALDDLALLVVGAPYQV
jgi:hypothetical protein